MIFTELKPLEEILGFLKKRTPVFLIGCADCATVCRTGGEAELRVMKDFLEKQGIQVSGSCVPEAPCIAVNVKNALAGFGGELSRSSAVLVMACGMGTQSVKENLCVDIQVLPGCNSLFPASRDAKGKFRQNCVLCGTCLLEETGALCPLALCPKEMLNGPCGGMNKGKCEVDREKDCVWALIYAGSKKAGNPGYFSQIRQPRDHSRGFASLAASKGIDHPAALH
ncbi:MAG: methylenetetrahydrofolate reductase C-terminal domain-containing protein [Candidatus Omnitrophota bacterium]|jgi:hypothetical protein